MLTQVMANVCNSSIGKYEADPDRHFRIQDSFKSKRDIDVIHTVSCHQLVSLVARAAGGYPISKDRVGSTYCCSSSQQPKLKSLVPGWPGPRRRWVRKKISSVQELSTQKRKRCIVLMCSKEAASMGL
jgi:hypothetical protein